MDGIVGWWPLHDDSARDYSGNTRHGTLNGGVTTGIAGRGGLEAMSFDGSDDWVDIPNLSALGQYTVSAWVRSNSMGDGNEGRVIASTANNQFMLIEDNPNTGEWTLQHHDTNDWIQITASGKRKEWQHICGTWDGSTIRLYVDGKQKASTSATDMGSNGNSDAIGKRTGGLDDLYYGGVIGDARVYSRSLSESEIQTLYEWGSGDVASPPTDGVSRYALDGDATDSWGSNDGTTSGGVSWSNDAIRGKSGDFDGSDDYITCSDGGDESTWYSPELTVSCWVKPDNATNWERIVSGGGSLDGNTSDTWALQRIDSSNHAFGVRVNGTYYNAEIPDNLPTREWSHICGTYDGGKIEFYTNGFLRAVNDSPSGNMDTRTNPVLIGRRSSSEHYSGLIDDVRIYDYALSQREVFELYRWGTFGRDMREHLVRQ
jgi:hypothetical protein